MDKTEFCAWESKKPIAFIGAQKWSCPKHGEVAQNVSVMLGIPLDGLYCLKCYAENVIVPNCERLTEIPQQDNGPAP